MFRRRQLFYRKGALIFKAVCVFIALTIAVLLLDARLRPAIYDLASLEAYAAASNTINAAVEKTLAENAPSYSELVTVNYSAGSEITGITTDIVKLNLFKSQVTKAIDAAFRESGKTQVSVSLGTASGITLFAGMGPYVDVDIGLASSTQSDFENVFSSAGINQTQHSIMLVIETTVMLTLPGKRITKSVETSFCVAQTVIVGSVPNVLVE